MVTSHSLGAVNSIMSKQLHYVDGKKDSSVQRKLFGYGVSFHMNMMSLRGESEARSGDTGFTHTGLGPDLFLL